MVLEMLYLPNLDTKLFRFDVSSNIQFRSGSIPLVYQHKWWLCRTWKCLRASTLSWYCIFWAVHSWNLQLMGHVWRICISFPKPFTQTSCSASHSCLQRIDAAWTAASMGIPSHHKIYSWLDDAFCLSIWKAETPRVHKVCVKDKFLLMCIFMSCVEGGVACCVLTTVQIIGITGIPLQKNTFPLHKKLLFCISHFSTASISQEAYLHDIFVEWVQKTL